MSLPVSRNTTYAPDSEVLSADLNDLQDKMIAEHARLGGGAGYGALALPAAPTAPDYHFSTPLPEMIHPSCGTPDDPALWTVGTFALGGATAISYTIGLRVAGGETIDVVAYLSQAAAVAGGTVSLSRVNPTSGTVTIVATVPIATATGNQTIPVIAAHAVVSGDVYSVQINFGAGGGFKHLYGVGKPWKR